MKISLAGDVQAPSGARAFVARQLSGTSLPGGAHPDDLVLIASELVTNAVQAGATSIKVDLLVTDRRVEITVDDDAGGRPVPRDAAEEEPNGRGLTIVGRLAGTWTVAPRAHGKSITAAWFDREV